MIPTTLFFRGLVGHYMMLGEMGSSFSLWLRAIFARDNTPRLCDKRSLLDCFMACEGDEKLCYTSVCMERRKKGSYKTKQQKKIAQTIRIISREIPLTETDRITYVYARDKTTDDIREVTNVSYEAWIERNWLTILRYDSSHGYLHQHTRFSLTEQKEFINKEHILQDGSHQEWLTWAIENIKTNFLAYRRAFFNRSDLYETEE
jgi:hypothetical protein